MNGSRTQLPLRFDHVDMGDGQDRLQGLGRTWIDGDEAAFLGMVRIGEEGDFALARRHPLGGERAAAAAQRRVGFDELLVKLAEGCLVGAKRRVGRQGLAGRLGPRAPG